MTGTNLVIIHGSALGNPYAWKDRDDSYAVDVAVHEHRWHNSQRKSTRTVITLVGFHGVADSMHSYIKAGSRIYAQGALREWGKERRLIVLIRELKIADEIFIKEKR